MNFPPAQKPTQANAMIRTPLHVSGARREQLLVIKWRITGRSYQEGLERAACSSVGAACGRMCPTCEAELQLVGATRQAVTLGAEQDGKTWRERHTV